MISKYFTPDQLGPSTQQMRRAKKIKRKTRCNNGWTPDDDNGKVMTGDAFKWLKG